MKVNLDCIPCFMHQALKTARLATDDKIIHEEVLKKTAEFMSQIDYSQTPPQLAHEVHRIVREITKNPDPYQKIKKHDNEIALKLYPEMKDLVSDSKDPLYTAVKLAAAGNIIDYGVNQAFDLEKTIDEVLKKDFARNQFKEFMQDLTEAKTLTYLADNAGEIVFDHLLIEELKDKDVTLVVKGGPIINDATFDDVKQVGLDGKIKLDLLALALCLSEACGVFGVLEITL